MWYSNLVPRAGSELNQEMDGTRDAEEQDVGVGDDAAEAGWTELTFGDILVKKVSYFINW